MSDKIKVMIVDDSAVIRGMTTSALEKSPNIEIISSVSNGQMAVNAIKSKPVDVVVLDIEMPIMDGITALPLIIAECSTAKVIMSSTLTLGGANITMKALSLGAADYISKPSSSAAGDRSQVEEFYRDLTSKVVALGEAAKKQAQIESYKPKARSKSSEATPSSSRDKVDMPRNVDSSARAVRVNYPNIHPKALAIASSTGGPQALLDIAKGLQGELSNVPIFITQHMPANFTKILASNIAKSSGKPSAEAVDGEEAVAGKIYVAPGDYHMVLCKKDGKNIITLNQEEKVNFCRPAADPMIDSLVDIYGSGLMLLVLTGMGSDGYQGAAKLHKAGGTIVVQEEKSCVVWGMPKAVVDADIYHAEVPLNNIADYLIKSFGGI